MASFHIGTSRQGVTQRKRPARGPVSYGVIPTTAMIARFFEYAP